MLCFFTSCRSTTGTGAFFQHYSGEDTSCRMRTKYTLVLCRMTWYVKIMSSYSQLPVLLVSSFVFSLSSLYCQTSSWIVFLEEETGVNLRNLVRVLSKFHTGQVRARLGRCVGFYCSCCLQKYKNKTSHLIYCNICTAISVLDLKQGRPTELVIGCGAEH